MVRKIQRTYSFDAREINEIVIDWLKSKDMPYPGYIGDTPTCKWQHLQDGGLCLQWDDDDEVPVSD